MPLINRLEASVNGMRPGSRSMMGYSAIAREEERRRARARRIALAVAAAAAISGAVGAERVYSHFHDSGVVRDVDTKHIQQGKK